MKKLSVIIVLVIISISQVWAIENISQSSENGKPNFNQLLGNSLNKLSNAKNDADLFSLVNELKRLDQLFPEEWLTDYYISFLDLQLSFSAPAENKENLLKEAISKIENLKQSSLANTSEVFTLEGYYYFARVAQNPAVNGQKYYKDVIGSYSKAIAHNEKNPRPALLLCLFKNRMAQFTGADQSSMCEDLEKIELMFADFTPKHVLEPTWGVRQLKLAQEKCKNN